MFWQKQSCEEDNLHWSDFFVYILLFPLETLNTMLLNVIEEHKV